MSTTKKPDDDLMQQLQEAALETVRLQARRSMSPEEQRLLANNLINILLGRGLPKDPRLPSNAAAKPQGQQKRQSDPYDRLVAEIRADHPNLSEEEIRRALDLW